MITFIRSRIQLKLVLAFIVVLLIPSFIVAQSTAGFAVDTVVRGESAASLGAVRGQVQALESKLSSIKDDLIDLSLTPDTKLFTEALVGEPGDVIRSNFQQSLIDFLAHSTLYVEVSVVDAQGQEIVHVQNLTGTPQAVEALQKVAGASYVVGALPLKAGQVYVSDLTLPVSQISATSGPSIRYSTPLIASSGDTVGVLSVLAIPKFMLDVLQPSTTDEHVYLLDTTGQYLFAAGSPPSGLTTLNRDQPHDVQAILSQTEGNLVSTSDHPDTLQVFAQFTIPAKNAPVYTLLRQKPIASLLSQINQVRQQAIIVFGLALLALSVILWLITRSIVLPLRELADAAVMLSRGVFDTPIPSVASQDEVARLASAFMIMAKDLQVLYANLEQRVQARTRELEAVAVISATTTRILDPDALLTSIQYLTRQNFDLETVRIFLLEEDRLRYNTEAYSLTGTSAIAVAGAERRYVLISDSNGSELALPLILGDSLIGVFDVQAKQANRFTKPDLGVFTALTNQIAVAIQNARSFTEQKRVAEELRRLDQLKSSFLANMSHELRTPLNAILNMSEFVRDGVYGDVNPDQIEALWLVYRSGRHLLSLINDVLDLSKIESGMMELFLEDIDLGDLLHEVQETAQSLIQDKKAVLLTEIEADLPTCRVDKQRLSQILLNLLSNAVKFTPEGTVTLGAFCRDGNVTFSVRDTGPGIAQADREIIFQPFRQTQAGLKKIASTGLGLPISKRLAEAHGGQLWLESQIGHGATFYVTLPIQLRQAVAERG